MLKNFHCYFSLPLNSFLSVVISLIFMQGIVTAPLLFAIEEFPQLSEVVDRGFDNPADVDIVSILSTNIQS